MNCDEYTKQFLYRLGVNVPEPLKYNVEEVYNLILHFVI